MANHHFAHWPNPAPLESYVEVECGDISARPKVPCIPFWMMPAPPNDTPCTTALMLEF